MSNNPAWQCPLVMAAKNECGKIWRELGEPSPLDGPTPPELAAAKRVFRAVIDAHDQRRQQQLEVRHGERKLEAIK